MVFYVAGTADGTIVEKKTWKVERLKNSQQYEQRCVDEFWNKYPDLRVELEKNQVSAIQFAHEFRGMLNEWEKTHQIYLLSDNPTFDAGYINYYLDAFELNSMQYGSDGKTYRNVHDGDSYARGRMNYGISEPWISNADIFKFAGLPYKPTGTNHMPADDAENIF